MFCCCLVNMTNMLLLKLQLLIYDIPRLNFFSISQWRFVYLICSLPEWFTTSVQCFCWLILSLVFTCLYFQQICYSNNYGSWNYIWNIMNNKILFLIFSCLKMNLSMICKSGKNNILQNWVDESIRKCNKYQNCSVISIHQSTALVQAILN